MERHLRVLSPCMTAIPPITLPAAPTLFQSTFNFPPMVGRPAANHAALRLGGQGGRSGPTRRLLHGASMSLWGAAPRLRWSPGRADCVRRTAAVAVRTCMLRALGRAGLSAAGNPP